MLEENMRRALLLSRGDFSIFLTRPISLSMLILTVVLVLIFSRSALRDRQARLANPQ
jgi:TctA family transporter